MTKQIALLTLGLLLTPAIALADSHETDSHETIVREVKQAIEDNLANMRATKMSDRSTTAKGGSYQFWSSGGLLKWTGPDDEPDEFDDFNLHPKHIEVIPLAEGVAAAMYYSEGSMTPKGHQGVANYRTRVMAVFVKEDGVWKERAGHWSPLAGGSGTSQTVD